MMQTILYATDVENPALDWIFQYCSLAVGCVFKRTTERQQAAVVYTNAEVEEGQLRVPVWPAYYEKAAAHCLNRRGYWVPEEMRETEDLIDYLGLMFRLLNIYDELLVPSHQRDERGNLALDLVLPRLEFRERPMVDEVLHLFKRRLVERGLLQEEDLLPLWPEGKRYAVLLTHDTDGLCLLQPRALAIAGVKGFVQRNRPERRAFWEGCRRLATGGSDPYFNFAPWAEFERTLPARSAFYVYVRSKGVPGNVHNPSYRLDKKQRRWHIIHELAEQGWEIGLHASMHALSNEDFLRREKRDLEDFLGAPVTGNRCHYWHINWRDPEESFRRLVNTGFHYDSSMAWRNSVGFRSGTSLPYYPFDTLQAQAFQLLEIPTAVMDGHFFEYPVRTDAHSLFASIVKQIREYGGVLNLNWHTETWVDAFYYEGWRRFLVAELQEIASSGEAWFATPGELTAHWSQRARLLSGEASKMTQVSTNAVELT
jgi:hypothetical protein